MCLRNVYQILVLILLLPIILVGEKSKQKNKTKPKKLIFLPHFTGFFDVLFGPVADLIVNVHLHHLKCYINTI